MEQQVSTAKGGCHGISYYNFDCSDCSNPGFKNYITPGLIH